MKKMKNITYLFLFLILGAVSCELPDNINPKAPSAVEASAVFTNAELALINHIDNLSQNTNVSRLLAQYWTQTTYFDESRYLFTDRNVPGNYWSALYKDALMDLKEAKILVNEEIAESPVAIAQKANKLALIDVLEVYAWHALVDAFGDIPYTEALMGDENLHPVYDDAAGIYTAILAQVSTAISTMDVAESSFGSADIMYGGDVASWRTFAASLKLRIAMRLADVNSATAESNAVAAVNTGVFGSGESATLIYVGVTPHVNSIHNHYIVGNRTDFLPTEVIIEPMKAMNDPRLPLWFELIDTGAVAGVSPPVYLGAVYGKDGATGYHSYSHFEDSFFEGSFPAVLMDYMEVEFLLAEARARGYAVGGTEEGHYNNAITASITDWGGTAGEAAAYLLQPEVAYSTATGTWRQVIGEQKWFGLYNRGVEAWAEWRRLDYPILTPPEGMTYADIPLRYFYPIKEEQLNKVNKDAAGSAIGGDDMSTQLFWDIN